MKPRCELCNKLFDYKEQAICAIRESTDEILFVKCLDCASTDRRAKEVIESIKWANYAIGTELILTN